MIETRERLPGVLGELQKAHLKVLVPEHHTVIAFKLRFGGFADSQRLINYSRSQAQRRWNEFQDFFLPFLGLPRHDDAFTGMWVSLHAACCLAAVFLLLKNDSRFASEVA